MSWEFATELARWGPENPPPAPPSSEAGAYCRRVAQSHYENFTVVSRLFPRSLRQDLYNIYAFCRWADDLSDEIRGRDRSLKLLGWWRGALADCYRGSRRHPVFVALGETIDRFHIPAEPFENLISAFEQDQRVREYETFADLLGYCRHSANPVGRLVLCVFRCDDETNVALSDSICTGLQLANFWQDVSRDLDIGRVYLPREDCRRFGYAWDDLLARVTNEPFLQLMQFQVARAREFLVAGLPLVERVPRRFQVDVDLFASGGLTILDRIESVGFRVWEQRPVVTRFDGVRLLTGAVLRTLGRCLRRPRPQAAGQQHLEKSS